jgi:hypothetical protein
MSKANGNPQTSDQPAQPPDEGFDLERLRLPQDFDITVGVKKLLITVPVRKPDRQSFIRVHPDRAYRLNTAVVELKTERETYLVEPQLIPELPGEVIRTALFTAIDRQETLFLWPVHLPDLNGRPNLWNSSAMQGAELAMKDWIRIASNLRLGAYELFKASATLPDPVWPDLSFNELLRIAFKDKFIGSLEHPVVQRLQGAK